jgi:hypothetical protein
MKTRRNFPKDSAFATEILEPPVELLASKVNGWTVKCSEDAGMGAANEESLPKNLQLNG